MRLKNFLVVLFLIAFGVLLVACGDKVEPQIIVEADFTTVVGEKTILNPVLMGTKDEDVVLVYESSDATVVEVDQTGFIQALKAGEATITVFVRDNEEVKGEVKIKVLPRVTLNDFAPTKIELSAEEETMAVGTSMALTVTLTPAGANNTLFWESSNTAVATVVNGTVFAHDFGKATIKAISAINKSVVGEIEVVVADTGTDGEVVDAAIAYLEAQLPEYVHESFTLPTHPNKDITVVWEDIFGDEIEEYEFTAEADGTDTVRVTVKYGEVEKFKDIDLLVTVDLDNNMHAKIPLVVRYLQDYFAALEGEVTGDLQLLTNYIGVPVTWMSNNTDVITTSGKFIRPDNDTNVTITASVGPGMLLKVHTFQVKGIGYTADEKIEYMKTQGSLKHLVDATITGPVSLPLLDDKFGAEITWASDKPDVLDAEGNYVNLDLAEDTEVTLTATVKYNVAGFEFEKTVDLKVTVKPLTDTGKAAILVLNAVKEGEINIPKQVVYNNSAFPGKIENLPTSVEDVDGVTITWYGREGEFNTDMEVLIPRISYTPTEIYAKFSKEGAEDVELAFPINIGVMEGKLEEAAFTARTGAFGGATHDKSLGLPPAEGGTGGTPYALGFENFYFKSKFPFTVNEVDYEWDFYFFFAPGNVKEWDETHLKEVEGKKVVDVEAEGAILGPQWGSTARFFKNTTEETIYVNLAELTTLGAQASSEVYTVFVIDADGKVTTGNVSILAPEEGVTQIEIPAGGMAVNPAYLDGPVLRPFGQKDNVIEVISINWGDYGK